MTAAAVDFMGQAAGPTSLTCLWPLRVGPGCGGSGSLPDASRQCGMNPMADDPEMLQRALDALPAPAEPLDVVMVDGFVCALQLRKQPLADTLWQRWVLDVEGRTLRGPQADAAASMLHTHAEARRRAIAERQWFDPWVFELDAAADPDDAAMPWAAGFAMAAEHFALALPPQRRSADDALALIYRFLDAGDWPAAAALGALIDEIEPPASLAEAVEGLVRAVLLLADECGPEAIARGSAAKPGVRAKPRSGRS